MYINKSLQCSWVSLDYTDMVYQLAMNLVGGCAVQMIIKVASRARTIRTARRRTELTLVIDSFSAIVRLTFVIRWIIIAWLSAERIYI